MGYYEIDDILADGTRFPCRFNYEVPGLGYLEGNPGRPISKNAKLELPLWMVHLLAVVGAQSNEDSRVEEPLPFVELLPPDLFAPRVLNAIKSGATSLDLHSISPHFYTLAEKWATLFSDKELSQVLKDMLLERGQEINNHAISVSMFSNRNQTNDSAVFLQTLDEFEKTIYRDTNVNCKEMKKWLVLK
ncbi:Psf3 [Kluyveromyces lactis]|nr:Psf3 [Kluyveromyces lactis]